MDLQDHIPPQDDYTFHLTTSYAHEAPGISRSVRILRPNNFSRVALSDFWVTVTDNSYWEEVPEEYKDFGSYYNGPAYALQHNVPEIERLAEARARFKAETCVPVSKKARELNFFYNNALGEYEQWFRKHRFIFPWDLIKDRPQQARRINKKAARKLMPITSYLPTPLDSISTLAKEVYRTRYEMYPNSYHPDSDSIRKHINRILEGMSHPNRVLLYKKVAWGIIKPSSGT
ncbi:MAG: hypothetical protein RhofKO_26300 [Rhodothermales bacterium]